MAENGAAADALVRLEEGVSKAEVAQASPEQLKAELAEEASAWKSGMSWRLEE